jgi:hypothetical protein
MSTLRIFDLIFFCCNFDSICIFSFHLYVIGLLWRWRPHVCLQRWSKPVRVELKCDGTRWRTGGEVKGKLANGVGSLCSPCCLGTWCIQHYYRWCAHLGFQYSTELTPPTDLNWLVRFAVSRNLVSARVPSHFTRSLPPTVYEPKQCNFKICA